MIKSHRVDLIIIADVGTSTLADRLAKLNFQNRVTNLGPHHDH